MQKNGFLIEIIKAVGLSLIIALVSILIFGAVNEFAMFNNLTIKIVNQIIKVVAILFGILKNIRGKFGIIKGMLVGLIFSLFMYLLFLIIGVNIFLNKDFFIDLLFGILFGAVSGIIAVNIKPKE